MGRARWVAAVSALAGLAVLFPGGRFLSLPRSRCNRHAAACLRVCWSKSGVDFKTDGIRPLWLLVPALGALVFGGLSLPAAWKGYEAVVLGNS